MYVVNESVAKTDRYGYDERRYEYLRLDLNENPGGLPEDFIVKVLSKVSPGFLSQYPEMAEFTRAYARHLGVEAKNLCLTNGSAEGIRYIIEGFTAPGGKIVGVSPSYAMYEVYASMYGRDYVPVRYGECVEAPVNGILEALSEDVQLLILLNPNNPMGDAYSDEDIERIMQVAFNNEITVLIDEAYHYIYQKSFLRYALEHERVFVTRTFSKLFSLAGCRLGSVIGQPDDIKIVQKLCTPHNVNAFAMLFAQEVFESPEMMHSLIGKEADGRAFLQEELDRRGYKYLTSHGNFVFFKPKSDAKELVQNMRDEKHILVKSYSGIGELGECVRVTTAERAYMQRFLDALDVLDLDE